MAPRDPAGRVLLPGAPSSAEGLSEKWGPCSLGSSGNSYPPRHLRGSGVVHSVEKAWDAGPSWSRASGLAWLVGGGWDGTLQPTLSPGACLSAGAGASCWVGRGRGTACTKNAGLLPMGFGGALPWPPSRAWYPALMWLPAREQRGAWVPAGKAAHASSRQLQPWLHSDPPRLSWITWRASPWGAGVTGVGQPGYCAHCSRLGGLGSNVSHTHTDAPAFAPSCGLTGGRGTWCTADTQGPWTSGQR